MSFLISISELEHHLTDVQIFEVGAKTANKEFAQIALQDYLSGHIGSAQYVDLNQDFCNLRTELEYQCPNLDEFEASLNKFNIDWEKPIVVYDRENHIWAARLFWVLNAFGHSNVRVLNGGLKLWQSKQRALSHGHEQSKYKTSYPKPSFKPEYFANLQDVKRIVDEPSTIQLLNVLRPVVYSGEEKRYARSGHIPKSINLPYAEFLNDDGTLKNSVPILVAQFGLDLNREIIIYCGSGVTASGAALALLQAQTKSIKIYDGSMSEWSAQPELPLNIMK